MLELMMRKGSRCGGDGGVNMKILRQRCVMVLVLAFTAHVVWQAHSPWVMNENRDIYQARIVFRCSMC